MAGKTHAHEEAERRERAALKRAARDMRRELRRRHFAANAEPVNARRERRAPVRASAAATLFEPLSVYAEPRGVPASGELRLVVAVLADALELLSGSRVGYGVRASDVAAARQWVEDGKVGRSTFDTACMWLGWDAERARRAILGGERVL